jgi:hypothetical protein
MALRKRVVDQDPQRPGALGAGGEDVFLAEHVEHRGAHHPRDDAGDGPAEHAGRQDQMVQEHAAEAGEVAGYTARRSV